MRKILFTIFLLCVGISFSYAQKFNLGLLVGAANYQGDVVESQISLNETHIAYGGFVRYNLTPKFDLKGNFYASKLSGDDANFESRITRGYKFTTNIFEGGLNLEWNILGKKRFSEKGQFLKSNTPYIYTGIGAVTFSPTVTGLPDDSKDLTANVKSFQFMVPFGVGYKFDITETLTFNAEFASHVPFTDYLDGVSFSGNPGNRDWYIFSGVGVSYLFGAKKMKKDFEGQRLFQ